MMKTILVSNDVDLLHTLRIQLKNHAPECCICAEATNILQAILDIIRYHPDVVFLDTDIEDKSGYALPDIFPSPGFKVVFIAGNLDYAVKAFQYNVLDYLLKPVGPNEITAALLRLQFNGNAAAGHDPASGNPKPARPVLQPERMVFPTVEGYLFVQVDEIIHIKSNGNYCYVSLKTGETHFAARSIKDFEEMLPPERFIRTHQSHIVNIYYIRKVKKTDGLSLHLSNGNIAPVSRRRHVAISGLLGI